MFVAAPDGSDVAAFLGQGDDAELVTLAGQHVKTIATMARSYTRGKGFSEMNDPSDDIAAVIITATARLIANPEQIAYETGSVKMRGGFQGWSLAELSVLNRYRKRSQ